MNYLVLSLIGKNSVSVLELERLKAAINRLLTIEFVDDRSIFWDEEGDLIFHPPVNKQDRTYWLSVLNNAIDKGKWEFILGKI